MIPGKLVPRGARGVGCLLCHFSPPTLVPPHAGSRNLDLLVAPQFVELHMFCLKNKNPPLRAAGAKMVCIFPKTPGQLVPRGARGVGCLLCHFSPLRGGRHLERRFRANLKGRMNYASRKSHISWESVRNVFSNLVATKVYKN